jgi:hypothetical protein
LIDLSSLAQTAFMQRLNAIIKTTVRITLAKWEMPRANYIKITDDSTRKGLGVPCVVQRRSLIAQQSSCLGIGSLCAAKQRSSDHRHRHYRLRGINRSGQFVTTQKSEEKHCFSLVLRLNGTEQPATKGGEID